MSPTTSTGRPASRARPMFVRSAWRRLISAGLPAPSQTTTSKRSRRSASARADDRPQLVLERLVGARVGVGVRLAHDDDLAVALARRLDEDRVHRRLGLDPGGRRLHRLRAPDLAAVGVDDRVQRHVLRLERRDAARPGARSQRQIPAVTTDLPASECVPADEQRAVHRAPPAAGAGARAHGARSSAERRGRADGARQPRRAVDVGGCRGARPSPRLGRSSAHAGVGERAAEPHAERAGERRLDPAGVRARMRGAVAAQRPASASRRRAADDRRAAAPSAPRRRRAAGPAHDVVEPRRGPAEGLVALAAMADHRVERVRRAVGGDAGRPGDRAPDERADDRVGGVLGDRLDRRAAELRPRRGPPGRGRTATAAPRGRRRGRRARRSVARRAPRRSASARRARPR